jgi:hypothetical protein
VCWEACAEILGEIMKLFGDIDDYNEPEAGSIRLFSASEDYTSEDVLHWTLSSKIDPRWNKSGSFIMHRTPFRDPEIDKWLDECVKKFGDFPDDLYYTCMKD